MESLEAFSSILDILCDIEKAIYYVNRLLPIKYNDQNDHKLRELSIKCKSLSEFYFLYLSREFSSDKLNNIFQCGNILVSKCIQDIDKLNKSNHSIVNNVARNILNGHPIESIGSRKDQFIEKHKKLNSDTHRVKKVYQLNDLDDWNE